MVRMLKHHHSMGISAEETIVDVVTGFIQKIKADVSRENHRIANENSHIRGRTTRIRVIKTRPERIHSGKRTIYMG